MKKNQFGVDLWPKKYLLIWSKIFNIKVIKKPETYFLISQFYF